MVHENTPLLCTYLPTSAHLVDSRRAVDFDPLSEHQEVCDALHVAGRCVVLGVQQGVARLQLRMVNGDLCTTPHGTGGCMDVCCVPRFRPKLGGIQCHQFEFGVSIDVRWVDGWMEEWMDG